jgi:hypothetical protein
MVESGGEQEPGALAALLRSGRTFRADSHFGAFAPDSPASGDVEACESELGTREPVSRVIRCADLWTAIAADQLSGLGLLIADGSTVFSMFPIVRSVIEHSAATVWVLDPDVSPRVRALRAALATVNSEEEACKASARLGGRGNEVHTASRRRLQDLRAAIQREFGTEASGGGDVLIAEGLPRPGEIVRHYGARWGDERQAEGVYDYLCATGNHPSLMGFEYVTVDETTGLTGFDASDMIERLARAALVPYMKALEHFVQYMGWGQSALDRFHTDVESVLSDGREDN